MRITAYAASDVGRHRQGNEDNMFSGTTVFAVADGMGGHQAGEVASEMALRPVAELDGQSYDDAKTATEALRQAIEAANRSVVSEARNDPGLAGMGTTLTAVMVRDDHLHLAHVGDSRAYLLRPGEEMTLLTTDHTLVEQLVQDGRLSRDEVATHPQRSVITRAVGVDSDIEVDTLDPLVLQDGDQILLCSDGLTGPVTEETIADLLATEPHGDAVVGQLIGAANDAGGPDNITVVLLRVSDDGSGPAAAAPVVDLADEPEDDETTGSLGEPPRSIPIRTRPESENHDWARDMSRYGDRQGVDSGTGLNHRPGRGRRVLGVLAGVLVLVGILAAGGYLVLSRAYFIAPTDNGDVGIYTGMNESVANIKLYRLVDDSGPPVADLPSFQQDRVRTGITVGSLTEAKDTVEGYRQEIDEGATEADGATEPTRRDRSTPAP
jgi:protein phosphatase